MVFYGTHNLDLYNRIKNESKRLVCSCIVFWLGILAYVIVEWTSWGHDIEKGKLKKKVKYCTILEIVVKCMGYGHYINLWTTFHSDAVIEKCKPVIYGFFN